MKNITLAIEEEVLEEVRVFAAKRQTTVNGLVRDYLKGIVGQEDRVTRARRRLRELSDNSVGRMGDQSWNRDKLYER